MIQVKWLNKVDYQNAIKLELNKLTLKSNWGALNAIIASCH